MEDGQEIDLYEMLSGYHRSGLLGLAPMALNFSTVSTMTGIILAVSSMTPLVVHSALFMISPTYFAPSGTRFRMGLFVPYAPSVCRRVKKHAPATLSSPRQGHRSSGPPVAELPPVLSQHGEISLAEVLVNQPENEHQHRLEPH